MKRDVIFNDVYFCKYKTPEKFSDMLMFGDGFVLTGLCFESEAAEKNMAKVFAERDSFENPDLPVFKKTKKWLDIYFGGGVPDFCPEFSIDGETDFQKETAAEMLKIPYGKTVSYGFIAKKIAQNRKTGKMSARAVGGAANANRICLIIPCHRIIGKNGELTGYGGGINNKKELLKLEKSIFLE